MASAKQSSSPKTNSGGTSKVPLFISLGIVATLIGLYFLVPSFHDYVKHAFKTLTSDDRVAIKEWISQFGFWGPLIIILAMVLQMFLIVINAVALMVVAVLAYGPFWGSLIALAAVFTASTVGYIIGLILGESTVQKLIGKKTETKMQDFVHKYGFWAVIITRISPFLSNDAISFIAGIARMNYFTFMLATVLGILPLIILIAWLSTEIDRLKTGLIWISVISLAALAIYIIYDKQKHKNQ